MACRPLPRDPVTMSLLPPGAGLECRGIPTPHGSLAALVTVVALVLALVVASVA